MLQLILKKQMASDNCSVSGFTNVRQNQKGSDVTFGQFWRKPDVEGYY